jgi:hypothetical protein
MTIVRQCARLDKQKTLPKQGLVEAG